MTGTRRATIVTALVTAITMVTMAAAASLGGVSSPPLTALTVQQSPTIPAYVSDNFSGTGNLNGRTATSGQQWTVNAGSMETRGNSARADGTGLHVATIAFGPVNGTVSANMTLTNQTQVGLMMHANGTTGTVMRVSSGGTVQLGYLSSGAFTPWATFTGGGTGAWALSYANGTYTVTNGGTLGTYTVPVGQRPTVEANTAVGLYSAGGTTNGRWQGFTATS